jgi:hypothetical protein
VNSTRFILSTLVVFLVLATLGWLLNEVVLSGLYELSRGVWRAESDRSPLVPLLFLNYLIISIVFVYLFARGYRGKGWAEGVRFGLVFGLAVASAITIERFVGLDIPARLALGWLMGTLFQFMLMGLATGLLYRHLPEPR